MPRRARPRPSCCRKPSSRRRPSPNASGCACRAGAPPRPEIRLDGAERTVALVEELARRPPRPGGRASLVPIGRRSTMCSAAPPAKAGPSQSGGATTMPSPRPRRSTGCSRSRARVRRFRSPSPPFRRGVERSLMRTPRRRAAGARRSCMVSPTSTTPRPARRRPSSARIARSRRSPRDADAGLRLARDGVPGKLLPVFVPPWNRIAPALLPLLSRSAIAASRAFGDRRSARARAGLRQINTHIDPIDWRGSRGLLPEAAIVARLAAAIAARLRRRRRRRRADRPPDPSPRPR